MGDISDMIFEGILCQYCGIYMGMDQDDDHPFVASGHIETCKDCLNKEF